MRIIMALLLASVSFSKPAQADDLCVAYACSAPAPPGSGLGAQPVRSSYIGFEVTRWESEHAPLACTCSTRVTIPTAQQIADAIAAKLQDAVLKGIAQGQNEALTRIEKENAEREKKLYDRIVILQEQNNAQIKLLTEMVKKLSEHKVQKQSAGPNSSQDSRTR